MEEKKFKSMAAIWGGVLIFLQGINLIYISSSATYLTGTSKTIALMTSFICLTLLILYLVLTLNKKIAGPILGIIRGAMSIFTLNILDIAIGVCFIVSCASFIKYISDSKKNNDNIKVEEN